MWEVYTGTLITREEIQRPVPGHKPHIRAITTQWDSSHASFLGPAGPLEHHASRKIARRIERNRDYFYSAGSF